MKDQIFDVEDNTEKAAMDLSDCDVLIAAVGENPSDTGEACSKTSLRLSPNQEKLVQKLKETGKPVVVIVFSGRPMELKPILPYCDALIQGWFLGTETGTGIADVLSGDYNPSGRLAMSFPQNVGQIPIYYNNYRTGRPYVGAKDHYVSKYLDCSNEPLYPFGYSLSYSNVEYHDFKAHIKNNEIHVQVTICNRSSRETLETVQLYVRDVYASVVRPVKELKGFQQIALNPQESRTINFVVTKDMLKFYNQNLEYVFEPGEFQVMIGPNSRDVETVSLQLS